MTTRFELHLVGMDVPEGLIDADRLVEIVRSLQDMATRLGRLETTSAQTGRPSRELDRVATRGSDWSEAARRLLLSDTVIPTLCRSVSRTRSRSIADSGS